MLSTWDKELKQKDKLLNNREKKVKHQCWGRWAIIADRHWSILCLNAKVTSRQWNRRITCSTWHNLLAKHHPTWVVCPIPLAPASICMATIAIWMLSLNLLIWSRIWVTIFWGTTVRVDMYHTIMRIRVVGGISDPKATNTNTTSHQHYMGPHYSNRNRDDSYSQSWYRDDSRNQSRYTCRDDTLANSRYRDDICSQKTEYSNKSATTVQPLPSITCSTSRDCPISRACGAGALNINGSGY